MELICKNCETENPHHYSYCPRCGQKTTLHRLSLHDIVHEAFHYFTHADKGLLQLIRDLAIKKGKVAREFVEGKRKKFYPPLTFFFLVIAINVFVSTKTDNHVNVNVEQQYQEELKKITDPVKKERWIEIYKRREQGVHFINTNVNTIAMVSLPIIAFIFWLFFRRSGYNYIEHLVAGMYMFGFFTLVSIVVLPVSYFLKLPENPVYAVCLFLQLVYYTLFYGSFIGGRYVRAFFTSLFAILFLFFISGFLMWIYMFMMK